MPHMATFQAPNPYSIPNMRTIAVIGIGIRIWRYTYSAFTSYDRIQSASCVDVGVWLHVSYKERPVRFEYVTLPYR